MSTTQSRRLANLYGRKPSVPKVTGPPDPVAASQQAVQALTPFLSAGGAGDQITQQQIKDAEAVSDFATGGRGAELREGYGNLATQWMQGGLTDEERNTMAARALSSGLEGGGFVEKYKVRQGGAFAQDRQMAGAALFGNLLDWAPQTQTAQGYAAMGPSSSDIYSKQAAYGQAVDDRNWLAAQIAAMPDPAAVGAEKARMTPHGQRMELGPAYQQAQADYAKHSFLGGREFTAASARLSSLKQQLSGLV